MGVWNLRVTETACKHRNIESACKKPRVKLDSVGSDINSRVRIGMYIVSQCAEESFYKVAHPNIFNFLLHLSEITNLQLI